MKTHSFSRGLPLGQRSRCRGTRSALLAVIASALLLSAQPASAGTPPWTDAPYSQYAQNAPLDTVLKDFAGNFSLALNLGPGLNGTVSGRFNAKNPTEFIAKLGSVYGFSWFTHAGTLFISRADDQRTAAIPTANMASGQLREALGSLGILDTRFGWGELPDQGLALVSGPPAYVDLIERTVKSLPSVAGGQQVMVFHLKHASVDDRTVYFRDKEITTPGLATILRNLILGTGSSRNGSNNEAFAAAAAQLRAAAPLVSDIPANATTATSVPLPGTSATGSNAGTAGARAGGTRTRTPSIQADIRLNSLIVHDIPERMPIYATLIKELDVPTALIEIQAMIVDVSNQRMTELGIDWGGRAGNSALGYNTPTSTTSSATSALTVNWAAKSTVSTSTLSVDAGNYLITRLRALEGIGDATIQSRRSVLTLDNQGALFDHSETFYIRTQGERVATVTPITAGTTLRVTPHVVTYDERKLVQLTVDVEDGSIQDKMVDALPTVMHSGISTQALVNEDQSLIIGGYNREQEIQRTDRVPVLGEIPLIGLLFSNKTTDKQKRQRLFLIKPHVIALPTADGIVIPDSMPSNTADVPEATAPIPAPAPAP